MGIPRMACARHWQQRILATWTKWWRNESKSWRFFSTKNLPKNKTWLGEMTPFFVKQQKEMGTCQNWPQTTLQDELVKMMKFSLQLYFLSCKYFMKIPLFTPSPPPSGCCISMEIHTHPAIGGRGGWGRCMMWIHRVHVGLVVLTGSCTTSGLGRFGGDVGSLVGWLVFVVPIGQLPKGWRPGSVQENGRVIISFVNTSLS